MKRDYWLMLWSAFLVISMENLAHAIYRQDLFWVAMCCASAILFVYELRVTLKSPA